MDGRVVFSVSDGYVDRPVTVGCGRCIGCRIDRSRQWAIRMMHESQMHQDNCFLTLTYSDDNLPDGGSLRKEDFQKFLKRLRARISPTRIKFYHCGEYGENLERPHYHAIIFGFDFSDKQFFRSINGNRYYLSELLSELWPLGHHLIGSVNFGSCQYVANYVTKKISGDKAADHYKGRAPEYSTQSNGIGADWFQKYGNEVFNSTILDDVVIDSQGHKVKPPRYYFDNFKKLDELAATRVRGKRLRRGKEQAGDSTSSRLRVREKVELSKKATFSKRSYEDGS